MFIELVDALRCPAPHEESWLVAAAARMAHRHIVAGTIGCPVCAAEYPVVDGVVDFRTTATPVAAVAVGEGDGERAMRMAALMNLADANGFAVLLGEWSIDGAELGAIVEMPLILVDPPAGIVGAPGISVLRCDGPVPLATGAARAVALDGGSADRIASAVRATRTTGRVLAHAALAVPSGVTELARDDAMWVGERGASESPIVTLHVRRSL